MFTKFKKIRKAIFVANVGGVFACLGFASSVDPSMHAQKPESDSLPDRVNLFKDTHDWGIVAGILRQKNDKGGVIDEEQMHNLLDTASIMFDARPKVSLPRKFGGNDDSPMSLLYYADIASMWGHLHENLSLQMRDSISAIEALLRQYHDASEFFSLRCGGHMLTREGHSVPQFADLCRLLVRILAQRCPEMLLEQIEVCLNVKGS
jgi:hypothetical protein